MMLDELHLLSKDQLALVVLRSEQMAPETALGLARRLAQQNPRVTVLMVSPDARLETLNHFECLAMLSQLADKLDASDLARLGLRRVTM